MREKWQSLKNEITDHIDQKRVLFFTKIIFILSSFIFLLNFINIGLSRYESSTKAVANASVAFFLIHAGTYEESIHLGEIVPSSTKYTYPFKVSNYDENTRSDVSLTYTVEFETTTNLPLNFELYKNENYTDENAKNIIENKEFYQNKDKMYFQKLKTNASGKFSIGSNQMDIYNLVVTFPEEYKNDSLKYEGVIESVKIKVNAVQTLEA